MLQQDSRALARPASPLDITAIAAHALAASGSALLALAYSFDGAARRSRSTRPAAVRPRDRLGPDRAHAAEMGVPDSWRVR